MSDLWTYIIACLAIIAIPGPAVIFILSRTIAGGYKAGFLSAAGTAIGVMLNALASGIGLVILFEVFPGSHIIVRYLGALYLVFLAYKTLRPNGLVGKEEEASGQQNYVTQSIIVSLLNPKITLFFAAFLPGFIDPQQPYFAQILFLAVIFVAIAWCFDTLIVLSSAFTRQFFFNNARGDNAYFQYASAICLLIVAGYAVI